MPSLLIDRAASGEIGDLLLRYATGALGSAPIALADVPDAVRERYLARAFPSQPARPSIDAILAEIGPRVRQLERQAQRTRDYARLSGELHEMQRVWFGYHWGKGQTALREAKEAVEAQTTVLTARRAEMGAPPRQVLRAASP